MDSQDRLLPYLLGCLLVFILFSRFLWDPWSQNICFFYVLFIWVYILAKDIVSEGKIKLPEISFSLKCFIVVFCISAFLTVYKEQARQEGVNLFNTLSLYFLTRRLNQGSRHLLQKILCASAALYSLLYITAQVIQVNMLQSSESVGEKNEFFLNINLLGTFFMQSSFTALELYKESKLFSLLTLIPISAGFFCARSSGLTGGLIALLYLQHSAILKKRRLIFLSALIGISAVSLCSYIFLPAQKTENSLKDRLKWWSVAGKILKEHPLFGSGPASFEEASHGYIKPGFGKRSIYAHNFPLQIASELGIPAIISLLIFLFERFRRSTNRILSAGLLAVFIRNLIDFSLNVPGFAMLFWMILGMA